MTPTHVEIMQCSGGCHRGNQACVPTLTQEKEVSVMLARCGIQTGKCEKECASLVVVEHLEDKEGGLEGLLGSLGRR